MSRGRDSDPQPASAVDSLLALDVGTQTTSVTATWCGGQKTIATTGTNIDSRSFAAGTWVITGVLADVNATAFTPYLTTVSGGIANSWTVIYSTAPPVNSGTPITITALVTLAAATTIYLTGKSSNAGGADGVIVGTRIR